MGPANLYCGKWKKISKSRCDLDLGLTMPSIELVWVIFIYYNVFEFHVPRSISFELQTKNTVAFCINATIINAWKSMFNLNFLSCFKPKLQDLKFLVSGEYFMPLPLLWSDIIQLIWTISFVSICSSVRLVDQLLFNFPVHREICMFTHTHKHTRTHAHTHKQIDRQTQTLL